MSQEAAEGQPTPMGEQSPPVQLGHPIPRIIVFLIIIVIIVALSVTIYFFLNSQKNKAPQETSPTTNTLQQDSRSEAALAPVGELSPRASGSPTSGPRFLFAD